MRHIVCTVFFKNKLIFRILKSRLEMSAKKINLKDKNILVLHIIKCTKCLTLCKKY